MLFYNWLSVGTHLKQKNENKTITMNIHLKFIIKYYAIFYVEKK